MTRAASAMIALLFGGVALGAAPKVIAVDVEGVIHPVTTEIVGSAIEQARAENAALVIIRLDTPGGLMTAMRDTISKMVAAPMPVVVWVGPGGARAASAGFFLVQAADVAAMAGGTYTGAAHPVLLTGQMDDTMKAKVESDASAYLRTLCEKRGRNGEVAETAVRQSKSFTATEALEQKLIDLHAENEQELLAALDGRQVKRFDGRMETLHTAGAVIEVYDQTPRQRVISAIADPNLALVLLVIGALGIYVEFQSPGLIAPGILGAISVLLGLSALSVLPINWLGAALLILAFVLFALEAKIVSHGILAAGGVVAMVLGAVLLVDSPVPEMRIRWSTALAVALPFALITAFLVSLVVKARRNKVETGREGMIGLIGSALTDLAPEGKVLVHGEYWDAVAAAVVPAGAKVRVTSINELRLTVESVSGKTGG